MTVPAKSCGSCSICCKALTFEIDGVRMASGVMCPHAAPPKGCSIHARRPEVCRSYFCGWHHLPSLGEDWRPDVSGILIGFREGLAPDGKSGGIDFEIAADEAAAKLAWPPLAAYIATLINDGDPVYLSLAAEPGYHSPWVYLNVSASLQTAVAQRHFAKTVAALKEALAVLIAYPKTRTS